MTYRLNGSELLAFFNRDPHGLTDDKITQIEKLAYEQTAGYALGLQEAEYRAVLSECARILDLPSFSADLCSKRTNDMRELPGPVPRRERK